MLVIGADVHKKRTAFHALDENGEPVKDLNSMFRSVPSNREGFGGLAEHLKGKEHRILMENSTKTHDVYWTMKGMGMDVMVAHSVDLARITRSDKKNDDNDAKELAMYMLARLRGIKQFRECYMCTEEQMRRRRLCRIAKQEMMNEGDLKRKIRSELLLFGIDADIGSAVNTQKAMKALGSLNDPVLNALTGMMRDCKNRRRELEKVMAEEFREDAIYKTLIAIPYFGPVTSAYLSATIIDVERYSSKKALASSLGLVPRQRDSGDTQSRCGITKTGDPHARWLLIQATFAHVSNCPDSQLTAFFNRMNGGSIAERREAGKVPLVQRKALVAAARKMTCIIYAMLSNDRTW
ncbi:MAG: IS110 family transposase [Candidatus Methanoplasma sp.]|jgi:transposase|nr:IS110 family transposase [Candidatus Methanoplasma sp.]